MRSLVSPRKSWYPISFRSANGAFHPLHASTRFSRGIPSKWECPNPAWIHPNAIRKWLFRRSCRVNSAIRYGMRRNAHGTRNSFRSRNHGMHDSSLIPFGNSRYRSKASLFSKRRQARPDYTAESGGLTTRALPRKSTKSAKPVRFCVFCAFLRPTFCGSSGGLLGRIGRPKASSAPEARGAA